MLANLAVKNKNVSTISFSILIVVLICHLMTSACLLQQHLRGKKLKLTDEMKQAV
jgi:hypothetical protein